MCSLKVIGLTALKTLSLRIRGYDEETEELSEDVIEATGKVADLTKVASNNYNGVSLWADAAQTKYKDLTDYLGEISEIWDEIDAKSQTELLDKLFGKRGASVGSAILLNFDQIKKALNEMEKAGGAAEKEMDVVRESITYRANELKQTWIGFLKDMIDRGVISDLLEDLTQLSEKIIAIIEINPKGILTLLAALTAFLKFDGGSKAVDFIDRFSEAVEKGETIKTALDSFTKLKDAIKGVSTVTVDGTTKFVGLGKTLSNLSNTLGMSTSALATFGVYGAIAAAAVAGTVIVFDALTTSVAEANADVKKTKSQIDSLKAEITSLEEMDHRSSDQEKRLTYLQKELELQEKIYEIEQKRALREKYGTKFSDHFDKDNANTEVYRETDDKSIVSGNLSHTIKKYERAGKKLNKIREELDNWIDEQNNPNSQYSQEYINDKVTKLNKDLEKYTEKKTDIQLDLEKKELEYSQKITEIEEDINSGLLDDTAVQQAKAILAEWEKAYWDIKNTKDKYKEDDGTDNSFEDQLRGIASNVSYGDTKATYESLYSLTKDFSEEQQEAWIKAVKNAGVYSEVIRLGSEAVKALEGDIEDVANAQSKLTHISLDWDLTKAEEKYEVDDSAFQKYLATFKELNPEIAENEELTEQAALSNFRFSNAMTDLESNLDGYSKTLHDSQENSVEYNTAIKSLADDLSALVGVDYSITNAQSFIKDKNNLDLLKQAIKGDDEALKELRENALDDIFIKIEHDRTYVPEIKNELRELQEGGNVNLLLRPEIDTKELNKMGHDAGEGYATVFSSTFSNETEDVAINFTPIMIDPETGKYLGVMKADVFDKYCQDVVDGVRKDDLNLQIGAKFEGEDAIRQAEAAAERIHELHDDLHIINTQQFRQEYDSLVEYLSSQQLNDIEIKAELESSNFYRECQHLVDTGELTKEEMVSIFEKLKLEVESKLPDFAEWKKKTDKAFDFKQQISDLNDLKTALDDVGNAMANVDEHGKFQLGDLDKIADYFIGLDDAAYDVEAVNAAIKLLGEDKGSFEQQAQAINIIADAYLRTSNVLDGLNEKNKDLYVLRLKEMGIINAEEIVTAALAGSTATLTEYKDGLIVKDGELVTAEGQSIDALVKSGTITEQTAQQLAKYAYEKDYANKKVIDTSADCANLITLMKTANASVQAIKRVQELKDLLSDAENGKIFLSGTRKENIKKKMAEIAKEAMEDIKVDYSQYIPQAKYNGGEPIKNRIGKEPSSTAEAMQSAAQKAAEEAAEKAKQEAEKAEKELEDTYDEFFDFFERRVKVCQDGISLLEKHLNNVVGSSAKNQLLDAQERIYKMQQNEYDSAKQLYQQMADQALSKLPQELADKIRNGAINITEFIGEGNKEVVDAINEYTKWADKVQDCKQQLAELKEEIRNLELSRFKNIMQDWQDVFDLQQSNAIDLIDKQIDLLEESGQLIGSKFYEAQKSAVSKQIDAMEQARRALSAELSKGLADGTIMKGSSQWKEMVDTLSDVEGKLLDAKKAVEQLDNAIINLHVETFERIMNKFDNFDDELSDIGDLLGEMDVADDLGDWTNEGLAQAGLLAQRYELAQKRSAELGDEIKWLNEQYAEGHVSVTEYADRLAELTDEQREAAKSAEDIKDSIVDLNRARIDKQISAIDKEIEAYEKLVSSLKDTLKAQKDLHDYERSILESTREITDLQKRISSMNGDTTSATIAKRKKLEADLAKAKEDLTEKEYDHSISAQEDALDKQLEAFKESKEALKQELEDYLLNTEQVVTDTLERVKENALVVGQTISEVAQTHGFEISEALTTAWQAGENAIASYGMTLDAGSSQFIANLDNVTNETWELQEQANRTSEDLANMFANRADNLVEELERSWNSEENLDNMTHALEDSFVSAINTGAQFDVINNPIHSAENAMDRFTDAVRENQRAVEDDINSYRDLQRAQEECIGKQEELNSRWQEGTYYEPPYKSNYLNGDLMTRVNNPKYLNGNLMTRKKGYAKGLTKAEKDELAWTQELGDEIIVSPTRNSILTPIRKNDGVLTAKDTANIFEWAKVDPKQILNGNGANIASSPVVNSVKQSSVTFDSLITVNGNVNDSMEMMKTAVQAAKGQIKQTLRDLNDEMKY